MITNNMYKIVNVWYQGVVEILAENKNVKFIAIDSLIEYNPSNHQYKTEILGRVIDKLFDHSFSDIVSDKALHDLIETIPLTRIKLSKDIDYIIYSM